MSCGIPPEAQKLLDSLDVLEEGPLGVLSLLDIPVPTTGAGVASALGLSTEYAEITAKMATIKNDLESLVPDIGLNLEDISPFNDGLLKDVSGFAENLVTTALAGKQVADEIKKLQTKYSGIDLGELKIDQIPELLRQGTLDLQNLCQKLPNFEEEGTTFVLKAVPISFPKISPKAIIAGHKLPELPKPRATVNLQRRAREAGEKFIQFDLPDI